LHLIQGTKWIVWNILLALIPVFLGYSISFVSRSEERYPTQTRVVLYVLGALWLVFMPNTCYLLTEWRHFLEMLGYTNLYALWRWDSGSRMTLMILTLFYMCYSGVGVITFTLAIRPVAKMFERHRVRLWLLGIPFFFLMSVGVYLGLILRFNSWELFNQFQQVLNELSQLGLHPTRVFYISFFAAFLWAMYLATDIWIDGLLNRFRK
jgi:uncharacterized membrane protein